jgi:hypothetical protein
MKHQNRSEVHDSDSVLHVVIPHHASLCVVLHCFKNSELVWKHETF